LSSKILTVLQISTKLQTTNYKHQAVHGTLKLENSPAGRDWKFGFHAFVLLMNAFNFGPNLSTIALYSDIFDPDKTFRHPSSGAKSSLNFVLFAVLKRNLKLEIGN